MMDIDKKVKYYCSLPYRIEIVPIPEDLGGGYEAYLPELGRNAMTGAGETPEEALQSLREVKVTVFTIALEEGETIQ